MSEFLDRMKSLAKGDKKTIVLPEGEDQRTIDATKIIVEEGKAVLYTAASDIGQGCATVFLQILCTSSGLPRE